MNRRLSSLVAVPLAMLLVGGLAACGEQTPGGTKTDGGVSSAPKAAAQGAAQAESQADAENPIVIKIGDQEFRSTMAIYRKYDEVKSGPLNLQAPTASVKPVADGQKMDFVSGTIYWSKRTGAKIVRGQILKTYLDNKGAEGKLGFPIGDETTDGSATYSDFEHGRIQLKDMAIQVIERK